MITKKIILVAFILVLSALYVFIAVEQISVAGELSEAETKAKRLEGVNREMSYELARADSLSNLSEKAAKLGFVLGQSAIFSKDEEPVSALR